MKGVMLTRFPEARVIDLTHETDVHFPAEAGFWLERSYRYFPPGTTHVAVVDPGVGTQRDIVVLIHDGHAFVAPDNGLLAPLVEGGNGEVRRLDLECDAVKAHVLSNVSATFHGRDIFAPIGAALAAGKLQPRQVGDPIDSLVPSWVDEPELRGNKLRGVVIAVDNFGNLITNISAELLAKVAAPTIRAGGHDFELRRTYGDVTPGDYLALINSFGVLELARAEQSASESLGLSRGAPVVVSSGA
jgi:S-adenosylmethionine hydrolase